MLTFVPVNLYSQFKRAANLYFLGLVLLQVRVCVRVCMCVCVCVCVCAGQSCTPWGWSCYS